MAKNKIGIGIMGFGTVGSGVVAILDQQKEKLEAMIERSIEITHILVRDKSVDLMEHRLTENVSDILDNEDVDIVVEVMGGIDTAYEYVRRALKAGKHVVTANKDLIALHGNELSKLAKQQQCDLYYEASVAGGIPVLRTLVTSLASDNITQVSGIVNGTTNFMLTKMMQLGWSYDEALKEAQSLGFAEANPSSDVDGLDAARKMIILTRLALGVDMTLDNMAIQGIASIRTVDIDIAKKWGYVIKLLGSAQKYQGAVHTEVGPVLVEQSHQLAGVLNENNAVFIKSEFTNETCYYGPGAGKFPTANSVVSDVVTIAKNIVKNQTGVPFAIYNLHSKQLTKQDIVSAYYYRVRLSDSKESVLQLLAHHQVEVVANELFGNQEMSVLLKPIPATVHDTLVQQLGTQLQLVMKVLDK